LHYHAAFFFLLVFTCCGRYYDDAMMQAEAQGWADAFNKRRPPKEVQFLTGTALLRTRHAAAACL
jgi:hypothetical protein